jgi:hypothetical protein
MAYLKPFAAAVILSALALAPSSAQARTHHRHHVPRYSLPYDISYLHNYGPGLQPGTFAYYDGPSTAHCAQSAAAYLGQDRRRHPCN